MPVTEQSQTTTRPSNHTEMEVWRHTRPCDLLDPTTDPPRRLVTNPGERTRIRLRKRIRSLIPETRRATRHSPT